MELIKITRVNHDGVLPVYNPCPVKLRCPPQLLLCEANTLHTIGSGSSTYIFFGQDVPTYIIGDRVGSDGKLGIGTMSLIATMFIAHVSSNHQWCRRYWNLLSLLILLQICLTACFSRKRHCTNIALILAQRLRRKAILKAKLVQRLGITCLFFRDFISCRGNNLQRFAHFFRNAMEYFLGKVSCVTFLVNWLDICQTFL